MKSSPLLTVAIPAFNVANFLPETLQTFLSFSPKTLEILIVNDGSTDNTKEIAEKIASTCPCITVINQKNSGAGGAINAAIKNAHGKYFRILDGDDWFNEDAFRQFISKLQTEKADLILTERVEVFIKSHKKVLSHDYNNIETNKLFNLSDVNFKKYGPLLSSTTIKTSILKKSNFKLDEKCFYVDQEYNLICYAFSETVIKYDEPVYYYRLEQDNQSMAKKNLAKNVHSHETVCLRLIKEVGKLKTSNIVEDKITFINNRIIVPLCNLQYEISIKLCRSPKTFLSFDQKLQKYPYFYNHPQVAGNIINFYRKTRGKTIFLDPLFNKLSSLKRLK